MTLLLVAMTLVPSLMRFQPTMMISQPVAKHSYLPKVLTFLYMNLMCRKTVLPMVMLVVVMVVMFLCTVKVILSHSDDISPCQYDVSLHNDDL